jgi:hypothetical protein
LDTPEELIVHLLAGVLDRGGQLGKTKLVKLLYLVDVEHYALFRSRPTGYTWRYYFYGPYDSAIENTLKRLEFDVPQEEVTTGAGFRAVTFRPRDIAAMLDRADLSDRVARSVVRILDRFALEDLPEILDWVYFHTPPMQHARPGDTLDFATIPIRPLVRPIRIRPAATEVIAFLKEHLRQQTLRRQQRREEALHQEQQLFSSQDTEYARFMYVFADLEESATNPEGTVLISPSWNDSFPAERAP